MSDRKKSSPPQRRQQLDLPLRAIDLSFVQVLTQQLRAGLIAEIGVGAFAVLTLIRATARTKDGRSYVSSIELGKATGLSQPTVRKAIDRLLSRGLVQAFTDGSRKRYFVIDQIPYLNADDADLTTAIERLDAGENDGKVVVRYIPAEAANVRQQLASWAKEGTAVTSPNVQVVPAQVVGQQVVKEAYIERLVVGEVVRADGTPLDDEGPFTRRLAKLREAARQQDEADERTAAAPLAGQKS
jgi:DNA-binding Lrp family transcriptional regulator